ncbi:hypothetical protein SAMN05216257_10113 [Meinhardsimonia xiamenensis]|jgi:uncharacterized membrane protein YeaQ/YmgE (transglycosylase-associated protein family)|uniref:Uncharacterized protein n=1 Tax=Meinhardsimonia xiamenensis TaxID=990712 RepID=A0A1G8XQ56_9RHOB|nr:hypothetical protein [Meinhardsimonia xiamenensis]PRX36998.1 hypothetical protein LV81_00769 [Meinhardsimonia xiamenensis]SDJ92607.1 hypothetical protein SAMN05216257_10113 [Meinhardsimonia xiamenensis]
MFFTLFGTIVIAAVVGYVSERTEFTRNGILPSMIICIGGAVLFYFARVMFGLSFGPPGVDALVSSIGALVIVPTHWRKGKQRSRK